MTKTLRFALAAPLALALAACGSGAEETGEIQGEAIAAIPAVTEVAHVSNLSGYCGATATACSGKPVSIATIGSLVRSSRSSYAIIAGSAARATIVPIIGASRAAAAAPDSGPFEYGAVATVCTVSRTAADHAGSSSFANRDQVGTATIYDGASEVFNQPSGSAPAPDSGTAAAAAPDHEIFDLQIPGGGSFAADGERVWILVGVVASNPHHAGVCAGSLRCKSDRKGGVASARNVCGGDPGADRKPVVAGKLYRGRGGKYEVQIRGLVIDGKGVFGHASYVYIPEVGVAGYGDGG